MTPNITTEGIRDIQAQPLGRFGGWRITFRSTHVGLHHQLYVNGALADWTDTPRQRDFHLHRDPAPRQVAIAAVPAGLRDRDLASLLDGLDSPAWLYSVSVLPDAAQGRENFAALLSDHGTGQLDAQPVAIRAFYPPWARRWAFGESAFGLGGLGYGGVGAPGLGIGAFGAGPFGMDCAVVRLSTVPAEEGLHQFALRTLTPTGQYSHRDQEPVYIARPPVPPKALGISAYDAQTQTLTLNIEEG